MKWIRVIERKPEYATPVPYRELMESVEGVNRYWYGQFEIFKSQFSIDGELNYEPHYLDKIEWLDESASDKDKEIERLKIIVDKVWHEAAKYWAGIFDDEDLKKDWQTFKSKNNL